MNHQILFLFFIFSTPLFSQNLQLHYDFRHSLDPKYNKKNFTTLSVETFKAADYGSFFMKMDADLIGENNNIGKLYTEISQTLRIWKSKLYLHLQYCGGLGIVEDAAIGYYINNAWLLGVAHVFQWKNAWFSTFLAYRYNVFDMPSHDLEYSLWWGKNFWKEKVSLTGHLVIWTENRDHGDDFTKNLSGKRFFFLSEPEVWINLNKRFSLGSEIKISYHVYNLFNHLQVYPTAAIKYNF